MNRKIALKIVAPLLGIAFALGAPQGAMAAGTAACTAISNSATTNFTVGGVPQTAVTSATATFKVGNKVNVDVSLNGDSSWQTVYPGTADGAMHFKITNLGNAYQLYALTTSTAATSQFGGIETFDASQPPASGRAIRIHNAVNGGGAYTSYATDKTIVLAPDDYILAEVLSDISVAQVDLDISSHYLKAVTRNADDSAIAEADGTVKTGAAGATTCTNAEGAYVVFADTVAGSDDAPKDGAHSIRDAYKVCAADLTVGKASAVYSDPINGTVSPRAIPGAVMTYTITVTNNGAAACANATSVNITDSLNSEITSAHLAFGNTPVGWFDDGVTACAAGQGIVVGGVCKTNASAADDNVDFNVTTGNTVTITGLSVPFGTSTVIKFQSTIQ